MYIRDQGMRQGVALLKRLQAAKPRDKRLLNAVVRYYNAHSGLTLLGTKVVEEWSDEDREFWLAAARIAGRMASLKPGRRDRKRGTPAMQLLNQRSWRAGPWWPSCYVAKKAK